MTATATTTSQAVAEWVRIFPKQVTDSQTNSTTFMKQLTVVAVSTITYLKNTFPEDSYMLENFAGVKLRVLKKKCHNELAQFLSTALTQAFEAIEKKYLHQLALCFYEKECKLENLMEYHIFEYLYHDTGVTMNVHSKSRDKSSSTKHSFENIRERTVHLIRACVVIMESCQNELPGSYDISLRLYYNDAAPPEYQAPGYLPAEGADHIAPCVPHAVKLGWVETPYHLLTASAYSREYVAASHEPQASQNPPILETNASEDQMSDSELILCSCGRYDAEEKLLTCQYCNTRQHATCYGVLSVTSRPHCCVRCSDADSTRNPTDPNLASLVDKRREPYCILRRALVLCGRGAMCGAVLAGALRLTAGNTARVLRLLHSSGVLPNTPDFDSYDKPQKIIPEALKSVMNKYFKTNDDIVERLVTESVASQNSSDPLGDVLSPLEKINLQQTTGRVIDNPQHTSDMRVLSDQVITSNQPDTDNQTEDPTLREYREAIMFNSSEQPEPDSKRTTKRKIDNKPHLRTGVKTKRVKAMPK